jgi:hypothetical protein
MREGVSRDVEQGGEEESAEIGGWSGRGNVQPSRASPAQ